MEASAILIVLIKRAEGGKREKRSASAIIIVIDNLIVHYAIDDATNEITIVTEAVRFDINHCLLIPDRFYHIGVVVTIGIRTQQLKTTFLCCSCDNPKR